MCNLLVFTAPQSMYFARVCMWCVNAGGFEYLSVFNPSCSVRIECVWMRLCMRSLLFVYLPFIVLSYCTCITLHQINDGKTLLKCCPPIRERDNREKLWAAVKEGISTLLVIFYCFFTIIARYFLAAFRVHWSGVVCGTVFLLFFLFIFCLFFFEINYSI